MRFRRDDALGEFRNAVADVTPLARRPHAITEKEKPPPIPRQRIEDEARVLTDLLDHPLTVDDALESGEEIIWLAAGLSRQVLRKLRRGHWITEAELDLHGLDRHEAEIRVSMFLRTCSDSAKRCVRIVHGKGLGSRNREPVLKRKLLRWLTRRQEVLACCQAPVHQGGSGATLVLLRGR